MCRIGAVEGLDHGSNDRRCAMTGAATEVSSVLELVRQTRTLPIGTRLPGLLREDGSALVPWNGRRVVLPPGYVERVDIVGKIQVGVDSV